MEALFAPWRKAYVISGPAPGGCVFCRAAEHPEAPDSLVVHRTPLSVVLMNLFPYSSGHVLVAPVRHVDRLARASEEEAGDLMRLARVLEARLEEVYRPDGLNVGLNLGRAAGAGVADHLHLHLVPRWNGDTNFMGAVGGTRIIPEDPREARDRLRACFTT